LKIYQWTKYKTPILNGVFFQPFNCQQQQC